jgi:hypothetical protein
MFFEPLALQHVNGQISVGMQVIFQKWQHYLQHDAKRNSPTGACQNLGALTVTKCVQNGGHVGRFINQMAGVLALGPCPNDPKL